MKLTDEVTDITYRNEENGYSVVKLAGGLTAIGNFAFLTVGQELVMDGEYIQNAKYGRQFKVHGYEVLPPDSPTKIKQFIGSGLIPGIGPVTAALIVKTFGNDSLKIMESAPEELVVVRGISLAKAKKIAERVGEIKQMQASVIFLQKFDISLNMAIKIYNHYKDATISRVQTNPYALIETIDGIGFLTADKMAKDLGADYKGNFRVRAGIVYTLKQSSEQDGNTYLPREKLFLETCKLLRIKTEQLEPVFDTVIRELCLDKYLTKTADGFMLSSYYVAERSIATRLNVLAAQTTADLSQIDGDLDELISHYEQINKLSLHETQRAAIKLAVTSGVCVITGGPGTGKTTIVKAILYIQDAANRTTQLLAPTGRAAKRLEETTGKAASTIHRALDIDYKNNPSAFVYDEVNITADMVIVDEVSMCDVHITNHLLKKINNGTSLLLVGDVDQLPSVGAGNVLNDIITSGVVPVIRLTEIYRQSDQSQIVISAHQINVGEMPDLSNKSSDFFFENCDSTYQIREKVVALVTKRIPGYLNIDHSKIQVLAPMKAGEAGMNSLNIHLQNALNPTELGKPKYEYGQTTFRLGDRVMQTANNYNAEWTRQGSEAGTGVFNGDIGTVIEINKHAGELTIAMEDGRVVVYQRTDLANLVLAYAITVHKSQGCEFDVAVIPVTSGAYMILTRNLLYTAVTRAKRMVVLVGSSENVAKMVNNAYMKKRHTQLGAFLIEMKEKVGSLFSQ